MLEFICYSLVWIFAIYGFLEVLKIIFFTFMKMPTNSNGIHILIGVKNCENYIETFLRTFYFKILNYNNTKDNSIIVVDMNSTDNTKNILKKLNKDFGFEYKELDK